MTKITITKKCPFCKKDNSVQVTDIDLQQWQNGRLIQNAFPYLSVDDREIIKTGICSSCWDSQFNDQ